MPRAARKFKLPRRFKYGAVLVQLCPKLTRSVFPRATCPPYSCSARSLCTNQAITYAQVRFPPKGKFPELRRLLKRIGRLKMPAEILAAPADFDRIREALQR